VLVYHDMLGMMSHPHHAKVTPKFCKRYAEVGTTIQAALQQYRDEVANRTFPGLQFSPYTIKPEEVDALEAELAGAGHADVAAAVRTAADEEAAARAAARGGAERPAPPRQW
jgi:3-methyl-2-oxobutanoate hydroxymethyltransferase